MKIDFFEVIRRRRSIRRFSDRPVAEQDLKAILEAARLAPSATNEQPWSFIVVRDRELKNGMRDMVDAMITTELLLNKQIYSESFLSAYRKSM